MVKERRWKARLSFNVPLHGSVVAIHNNLLGILGKTEVELEGSEHKDMARSQGW